MKLKVEIRKLKKYTCYRKNIKIEYHSFKSDRIDKILSNLIKRRGGGRKTFYDKKEIDANALHIQKTVRVYEYLLAKNLKTFKKDNYLEKCSFIQIDSERIRKSEYPYKY